MIRVGAYYGLTPDVVLDCEVWQINNYIMGAEERIMFEREENITNAYMTASLTNARKKPPKLSTLFEQLRKKKSVDKGVDKEVVDKIEGRISELGGARNGKKSR